MRRVVVLLSVMAVLVPGLPAGAQPPGPSAWPGSDGSPSQTRRSPDNGPENPGVAWTTALSDIDAGTNPDGEPNSVFGVNGANNTHGYPIIDDGQGHVVAHVEVGDPGSGDRGEALIALDQVDGSMAWLTDPVTLEVRRSCPPLLDSTGALWALASRSADTGVAVPSALPVRIDASDGSVVERPLDADTSEQLAQDTRGGFCSFAPTITPADVMVFQFRTFNQPILGIDLTDGSMAFRVDVETAGYPGEVYWAVPTPDGQRILVGVDDEVTNDDQLTVLAIDALDGTILDSTVVTGGQRFYTVNEENPALGLPGGDVVFGITDVSLDDGRLLRLTPDLGVVWNVPTARNAPEGQPHQVGTLSLGGRDGELVIGWSISNPNDVFAVSVVDGSLAWSANPESFDSVPSITVDASGTAYLATRGIGDDARVQVLGPDGTPGATLSGVALADSDIGGMNVSAMGPVVDGQLFVALEAEEDTVFMAVDNSGGGVLLPPGVSRPAGTSDDPRQIAIDLCRSLNPADGSARAVILAQDEIFADALTGSPLAGDDGCVLFTGRAPESLDSRTAAEIDRALPDGGTVYLLGGGSAVAASVESALDGSGYAVQRLSGPGRVQTATAIAQEVQLLNPANTTAMLAFEGNWPDAVAGGAYGAQTGVPILLTGTDTLPDDTLAYLTASETDEVILLGSNAVISDAIEEVLFQPIIRAGGVNRMATAVEIAAQLWQSRSGLDEGRFLMVNLEAPNAWTIALAAAPLSARVDAPQLGIGNTRYPSETSEFLASQGFETLPAIGLIGGVAFIGEDIESEIETSLEP